jgi:hypothetical protein
MNLQRLLPSFKPRRTFESVVRELIQGLRDGSIVLGNSQAHDGRPSLSSANGQGSGEAAARAPTTEPQHGPSPS